MRFLFSKQLCDRVAVVEDADRSALEIPDAIVRVDSDRGVNRRGQVRRPVPAGEWVGGMSVALPDDLALLHASSREED